MSPLFLFVLTVNKNFDIMYTKRGSDSEVILGGLTYEECENWCNSTDISGSKITANLKGFVTGATPESESYRQDKCKKWCSFTDLSSKITDIFRVDKKVKMTTLDAVQGDICICISENKTYILKGSDPSILSHWVAIESINNKIIATRGWGSPQLFSWDTRQKRCLLPQYRVGKYNWVFEQFNYKCENRVYTLELFRGYKHEDRFYR